MYACMYACMYVHISSRMPMMMHMLRQDSQLHFYFAFASVAKPSASSARGSPMTRALGK